METIDVTRDDGHRHDHARTGRRRRTRSTATMWDELLATFREIASSSERPGRRRSPARATSSARAPTCSGGAEGPRSAPARHDAPRRRRRARAASPAATRRSPRSAASPSAPAATWRSAAISSSPARTPGSPRSSPGAACRSTSVAAGCCRGASACTAPRSSRCFADIIDAAEAERIGLVNRVVADDELDAFVDDWAQRLAAGAADRARDDQADAEQLDARDARGGARRRGRRPDRQLRDSDTAEAMKAFVEKRDPKFEGR